MSRIITWFVNNPVAANLFMLVMVVGGALSLPSIHQEEFPSIETGLVRVSVTYLGAAPEEVEQGVCVRIEEALEGATGIKRISSLSVEGACVVTAELESEADYGTVVEEIKNRVNAVDTLPIETFEPMVRSVFAREPWAQGQKP
jgi:multidrug efflux pump subunit AcrB